MLDRGYGALRRSSCYGQGMADKHSRSEVFATAEMHFRECIVVRDFVENKVLPILSRDPSLALPARRLNRALAARVLAWLRSLAKLNQPSDSQAILAGSRGLFELALDFTLLKHEKRGDASMLLAWQESEKLKWTNRVAKHAVFGRAVQGWASSNTARIKELRQRYWGGRHPMRWTGRQLSQDTTIADGFQNTGFVEYYTAYYTWACWQVHGSGAVGLLEATPEQMPYFSAQGFADCAKFAIASAAYALDMVGQYDAIADERFKQLNLDIASIQMAAMPREDRERIVKQALSHE